MKEKLLFFDIDGTLIECNLDIFSITEETKRTLDRLKDNGHSVFLATGRCKNFIVDGVMEYPFSGYVTCNGAYVEYLDKEVYKEVISKEALKATDAFCKDRNMIYYFESRDYIYVLDKLHPSHLRFKENWRMKDEIVVDQFDLDKIEVYIGMVVINTKEDVEPMIKALSPYFDIQKHQSGDSFDLTLKGVSKAVGIQKLVKSLNKDIKDTIAFGDGRNDIEMLETVGLGVAMGNGCDEAKASSDYITDSIENEGITKALENFKLI